MSDIVELTLALASAQDKVTHYNVTRQYDPARRDAWRDVLLEDAKVERDNARTAIHDAFHAKDERIAELETACRAVLEAIVYDAQKCGTVIWVRPPYAAEAVHESVADRLCEALGVEIDEAIRE